MQKEITTEKAKLKELDSIQLAKYILAKCGKMTHLKIHKLIYYTEAYHLAYFDKSIIEDDFRAWVHGPVVLNVWHELKNAANVYDEIKIREKFRKPAIKKVKHILHKEQYEFINAVLNEFAKRSAYELECLTHSELPWIEARGDIAANEPCSNIISKKLMKKFYREKLFSSK